MKLSSSFYTREDVVQISQELLGKYLFTQIDGEICAGMIVETEAYCGASDRACHAFGSRRTARTEVMFAQGGVAYVYLCYGIHHLFNVVTNQKDQADAVLIRAIEPKIGEDTMLKRRNFAHKKYSLTAGPGAMSGAMGIQTAHYGTDLQGDKIWIEDRDVVIQESQIIASPRVGVAYAGEDALLPWRFRIQDNPWCSKAK
ncbi:MAG: DNA-3-methyladenine glycosylase [Microscillaceae bacterium]|nr:DNA-3-methyladenine glycosylase [Microscillaceae bacterium]